VTTSAAAFDEVVALTARARWITVFSGAGMSAESGIPTFRDAQVGLWENYDPASLATPEAWEADPDLMWAWYRWRARLVRRSEPNAGHHALVDLPTAGLDDPGDPEARAVMIVTQNVDDLHERAGTPVLSHLHGSLFAPRCSECATPYDPDAMLDGSDAGSDPGSDPDTPPTSRRTPPSCPVCGGRIRPGVVWFGEALPEDAWQRAESAFRAADLVIVVGTSGVVYPAASLPERAAAAGVPVVEINPEPSALSALASHHLRATAATALPALVSALSQR
jgi:NAD-dependent deacetylase